MATKKDRPKVKRTGFRTLRPNKSLSAEEIDKATREVLQMLINKLSDYLNYGGVSKLKVKYGESKPLEPLYPKEGGKHVGYIQRGPRILSLVIEDFTDDGAVKGIGEKRG